MKKILGFFRCLFFLLSFFAFFSCMEDDPVRMRQNAINKLYRHGRVKIAVANSFEQNKTDMWDAALLAQDQINNMGLCPVQIELIKCDDGGTPLSGTKKAYEIASDNEIAAVIGHGYSDISMPCSLIYQYYGILTINYISTIYTLTDQNNPYIFSNMPNDNNFGAAIAEICGKNGYERVIIYYLDNISGTSLSNSFELNCNNRGIEVVTRDSYDLTANKQIFETTVKRWKNNFVFDAVFIAGRMPSLGDIIVTLRENGIDCPIVGADPFDDPLLTKMLGPSENGRIFAVSNYNLSSKNFKFQDFFKRFKERYGHNPDQEALQVYDALLVLADAINESWTAEPQKLAEILRKGLWYEAAGPYSFYPNGAVKDRELTKKVFKDGRFEEIKF
ncbi:MAG: ABC transporter substrate-binding protein [Treponema sp.]|nr:ABC transporter substrate-binding protein [Treponema sp.]